MNMPGEEKDEYNGRYGFLVRGSNTAIKVLIAVLIVVIVIFLAKTAYSLGYEVSSYEPEQNENAEDIAVLITADMSVEDVGKLLIEKGVINESLQAFLIQESLSEYHDQIVPKAYLLNSNMTVDEILETICATDDEAENDS